MTNWEGVSGLWFTLYTPHPGTTVNQQELVTQTSYANESYFWLVLTQGGPESRGLVHYNLNPFVHFVLPTDVLLRGSPLDIHLLWATCNVKLLERFG